MPKSNNKLNLTQVEIKLECVSPPSQATQDAIKQPHGLKYMEELSRL